MSTTTVCRVGLQSCLEPKIVEPLTLHLTLVSPKPNSPQSIIDAPPLSDLESDNEEREVHEYMMENINNKKDITSSSNGGWSFIESLTKDANEDKETTTPYVHPLDKRSMSTLTNKSLELCTESLGSETGSDISDENDLYSSSSSSDDSESRNKFQLPIRERSIRFSRLLHKKAAIRPSFPPPLTSISGSDYVQFTPHREGGRLVIKAVTIATAPTCFEAERSNGRLRLHFKTSYNYSSSSSSEEDTDDDDEQDHRHITKNDDQNTTCKVEDDEMAIVKYQRPCSWYKDSTTRHGNKSFINWKPFLGVAM